MLDFALTEGQPLLEQSVREWADREVAPEPSAGSDDSDGRDQARGDRKMWSSLAGPAENLVGREGEGFKIAKVAMDQGRYTVATGATGLISRLP